MRGVRARPCAVFIAKSGHRIFGLDQSANGIRDLVTAAKKENLVFESIVADITAFTPSGEFDVILIDRILHMLERASRLSVPRTLLDHVSENGWMLIADEFSNIEDFQSAISAHSRDWITDFQKRGYLFVRRT